MENEESFIERQHIVADVSFGIPVSDGKISYFCKKMRYA